MIIEFEQVDHQYTRNYGGTGLGLSISRKLVELMGGKLDYRSEIDIGSEFFFTISVTYANDLVDAPEAFEMHLSKELNKDICVLVVDDDEVNQKVLGYYLNKESIRYVIAGNGQIAVDLFVRNEIDIIFMDINMPIMNGFEAFY